MNQDDLAAILACPLFKDELDPALSRDIKALPYRMSNINSGKLLMLRKDLYEDLLILVSGTLVAFQEDSRGHRLIIETLKAPQAVAVSILFAPIPRMPVSLRAKDSCRLFLISKKAVLQLCQRYPKVLENLLHDMGRLTVFLSEKLHYLTFTSIRQKLAIYLLETLEAGQSETNVNKEHLAELFAVNRPSLSRVCQELVEKKIIRMEGHRLIILDPKEIRRITKDWKG